MGGGGGRVQWTVYGLNYRVTEVRFSVQKKRFLYFPERLTSLTFNVQLQVLVYYEMELTAWRIPYVISNIMLS
jgi:hypothetical protein